MSGASLPSWARKGVKVVCIYGGPWRRGNTPWRTWLWLNLIGLPIHGGTYTIAAVGVHHYDRGAALRLKGFGLAGFHVDFFRPLVSTKTEAEDVAEFRKLLTQPIPEAV